MSERKSRARTLRYAALSACGLLALTACGDGEVTGHSSTQAVEEITEDTASLVALDGFALADSPSLELGIASRIKKLNDPEAFEATLDLGTCELPVLMTVDMSGPREADDITTMRPVDIVSYSFNLNDVNFKVADHDELTSPEVLGENPCQTIAQS